MGERGSEFVLACLGGTGSVFLARVVEKSLVFFNMRGREVLREFF